MSEPQSQELNGGSSIGAAHNLTDAAAAIKSSVATAAAAARKDSKWEILTSLDRGTKYTISPKSLEGFLAKRRKWPLKGWHKRYFVLEKGILTYGKSEQDIKRGRTHGRIDVGLAVISAKTEHLRIEIDDEEFIHHLKARDAEVFGLWLEQLQQHRFYQQNLLNAAAADPPSESGSSPSPRDSLPRGKPTTAAPSAARNGNCMQELSRMDDRMTEQLLLVQQQAVALGLLAQRFEDEINVQHHFHSTAAAATKKNNLFGFRKKKPHHQQQPPPPPPAVSPVNSASCTVKQQQSEVAFDPTTNSSVLFLTEAAQQQPSPPIPPLEGRPPSPVAEDNVVATTTRPLSVPLEAGAQITSSNQQQQQRGSLQLTAKLSASSMTSTGAGGGAGCETTMNSTYMSTSTLVGGNSSPSKDELIAISQELQQEISNLLRNYTEDRDRLKVALQDQQELLLQQQQHGTLSVGGGGSVSVGGQVAALRQSLSQVLQQNMKLRARLQKIHLDADISDLPAIPHGTESLMRGAVAPNYGAGGMTMVSTGVGVNTTVVGVGVGVNQSLSYSSMSEFFDAREYNTDGLDDEYAYSSDTDDEVKEKVESETGSEADEDDFKEVEPEVQASPKELLRQDVPTHRTSSVASTHMQLDQPKGSLSMRRSNFSLGTGRRTRLPAIAPNTPGLNLWNLLCKNIGKDLSKISMPVTLNEPLGLLQRMCEELEYSELLDKAVGSSHQMERMMWVAAFAMSTYGYCNDRAGHKPFNPLLGETYECIREDKGFRYMAEQVSHHPPVAACHAESEHWTWWQDFRVKTKFWGKSMEFQPEGTVKLELRLKEGPCKEVYTWNKVTTCIHNLFGNAERWADLYGQCQIRCWRRSKDEQRLMPVSTFDSRVKPISSCNLELISASGYWNTNKRHEVRGTIKDASGKVVQNIFGKCTEALYCGDAPSVRCIWRPGTLPEDNTMYYGFSRFAIELNEILPQERDLLPITDTRFRPDQRCLEEGKVAEAESLKLKLEQAQRERRQKGEEAAGPPRWFKKLGAAAESVGGDDDGCTSHSSRYRGEEWQFTNEYWTVRKNPGFRELPLHKLW